MLFIYATIRLAKSARLKLEKSPALEKGQWIDHWYANSVVIGDCTEAVIFTNPETLYSFLVPTDGQSFFAIVEKLRSRLAATLAVVGMSEQIIAEIASEHVQYTVCKTDSRRVLGCMNEMVFEIQYYASREDYSDGTMRLSDIEQLINETPFKPLGFQFPSERFAELAKVLVKGNVQKEL